MTSRFQPATVNAKMVMSAVANEQISVTDAEMSIVI